MLQIPQILDTREFLDAPLDYKWKKEDCRMYYLEYINDKLSHALWNLNHRSTVGLATALAEWSLWRLSPSKQQGFTRELSSLEAMWAGLVDKNYIFDSLYKGKKDEDKVIGPLWVIMKCMEDVRYNYIEGKIFINGKLSALAAIARLVTPEPYFFDNWLTSCIKRASELFPAEYDRSDKRYDNPQERYSSSHEPPIPREFFFEPDFDYSKADIDTLLNNYISSLDYQTNEFLNSPEKMVELGFQGTPYRYEPNHNKSINNE